MMIPQSAPLMARAEDELILCCSRSSVNEKADEKLRTILRSKLDWPYILTTAFRNGVIPLLYVNLKRDEYKGNVGPSILDPIRTHFLVNFAMAVKLTNELVQVDAMFKKGGIAALAYKGPALAASVYGGFFMRQFGDLDILVQKDQVVAARDLLISMGYRPSADWTGMTDVAYLERAKDYKLFREAGQLNLELHWAIVPRHFSFPFDIGEMWKRAGTVSLNGSMVSIPSAEDLLLVLCVHGSKHHWERLGWICDIAELVRVHKDLDWNRVIAQAEKLGAKRMLFLGLILASELLDGPVPGHVLEKIQADTMSVTLCKQVRQWLFQENQEFETIHTYPFFLNMRERFSDKIRVFPHLLRQILEPTAKDTISAPTSSFANLRYAVRPLRLIRDYGMVPVKTFVKALLNN